MTVIFLGPTLSRTSASQADPHLVFRPPARRGSILEAVEEGHRVLLIVDGYFQSRAAVWHKEILWAMEQGCTVVGASSMGALRAVELRSLGMIGIGRVYRAFLDGELNGDDEVAIEHGPAQLNYLPCSVALVDMRATFSLAVRCGVICRTTETSMLATAKHLFFGQRTYARVVSETACDAQQADAFLDWLRGNAVLQKAIDALEAIAFCAEGRFSDNRSRAKNWVFEETTFWRDFVVCTKNPLARVLLPGIVS